MNADAKFIGTIVLIIFIGWNILITFMAFAGCPPQFAVLNMSGPDGKGYNWDTGTHITESEINTHPGLADAFRNRKSILLPVGTLADFIPGDLFGPEYARTRIPIWERDYLETNHNSIWEYNGSYYKLAATLC